ncbi:MAG: hypothetical protein ACQET3_10260, partial [Promethearchaeati archaeon]
GRGESAAVRCVQLDLSSFGDEAGQSDNNPAVARTVEDLTVAGVMTRSTTGDRKQDRGRNLIPLNADEAPANLRAYGYLGGGNASRGRVEHRSFMQLLQL